MPTTDGFDFDELLWERDRRRFRGSDDDLDSQVAGFEAFCREHVWIQHPLGRRLFPLRPEQIQVARSYIENEKTISLKARQIGFTTVTMAYVLWRSLFFDEWTTIVLSKKERDAQSNLRMAIFAYQNLDDKIKSRLPKRTDNSSMTMTFENGSWIESHPSMGDPARGRTVRTMVLDEWAFMPNPEEAWAAVEPVTDVGGQIIVVSTANGWGNLFHETWRKAKTGDNGFNPIFFPWWAVPDRLTEADIDDPLSAPWFISKCRQLPEWQRAQEYPSSEDEAFIKSGNMFFDLGVLEGQPLDTPLLVGNLVNPLGVDSPRGREFIKNDTGYINVWSQPKPYGTYVIGADVAEGLKHGDFSSAHVIDCAATKPPASQLAQVAATWHGHIDPDLFAYELAALGWWYGTALIGVEANNHGMTTLKALKRIGYPRIYLRRDLGSRTENQSDRLGWFTSAASKPLMMDELSGEMRNDTLRCPDNSTIEEMRGYVRDEKGKLSGSPHDDRVISLAIANQMRKWATDPIYNDDSIVKEFTVMWAYNSLQAQEQEANKRRVLGAHNVRRVR